MTRSRLAVVLATVAALAVPAGSTTAGAVACPGVHRSGEVATVDLPKGSVEYGVAVAGGSGVRHADVLLVATNRTLWRSADGGCTWAATLSLDADAPPPWRSTANYGLWSVAAAAAGPDGHHTVYAVAGDALMANVVATPVVVYVSRDDGVHWTVREPEPADLAGELPRCSKFPTRIDGAPEPGTAYLTCGDYAFGELPVTLFGPECQIAVYVTHDYAATWQPVSGRVMDPTLIAPDRLSGCRDIARAGGTFFVDRHAPKTLWQLTDCTTGVDRSTDGGRTFAPFVELPRAAYFCTIDVRSVPGVGTVALSCGPASLVLAAAPGGWTAMPKPIVKVTDAGQFQSCALDPVAPRAIGFYYDGRKRCVAYAYDLLRKSFRVVGYGLPDKAGCPWRSVPLTPVSAPGSRGVYTYTYWASSQLVRVGPS